MHLLITAVFLLPWMRDIDYTKTLSHLLTTPEMMNNSEPIKHKIAPILDMITTVLNPAKIFCIPINGTAAIERFEMLVVLNGTTMTHQHAYELFDIILSDHRELSCQVVNEGEVMHQLKQGHLLYSSFCKAEHLLFDNGKKTYPIPDSTIVERNICQVLTEFKKVQNKAEAFYSMAMEHAARDTAVICPFLLQQSIELCLRAVLQALNGQVSKTHEVRVLLRHLRRRALELYDLFVDTDRKLISEVHYLDLAYIKSRYETDFTVPSAAMSTLFAKAECLLSKAKMSVMLRLRRLEP